MKNLLLLLLCINQCLIAQDTAYARTVIKKLSSEDFSGRGYTNSGHQKASNYISTEFKNIGLTPLTKNYKQFFPVTANVFPDQMTISIDKKSLIPGLDFLVHPSCPSINGKFELVWLNEKIVGNKKKMSKFVQSNLSNKFIIVDKQDIKDKSIHEFLDNMIHNPFNAKGIIFIEDEKLTWGASTKQFSFPIVYLNRTEINTKSKFISLQINAFLEDDLTGENVIGYLKNDKNPNKFIILSANYDHIGMMGSNTIFKGSNYHASGVAMLLDLAKYYKQHLNELNYSIVFVAFSGEKLGQLGSKYFLNNPLIPNDAIKFALNLSSIGNGEQGLSIMNAKQEIESFLYLKNINIEKKYLMIVNEYEGNIKSAESSFTAFKIPSISFLTLSRKNFYNDLFDKPANLSLVEYQDCFFITKDFLNQL